VADAVRRGLISAWDALSMRNFLVQPGGRVCPRSIVRGVSYEPGENRSAEWRARSKAKGFDGRFHTCTRRGGGAGCHPCGHGTADDGSGTSFFQPMKHTHKHTHTHNTTSCRLTQRRA
jgi:hypothetical protein